MIGSTQTRAGQLFGDRPHLGDTLFQQVVAAQAAQHRDPHAEADRRRAAERAAFDQLVAEERCQRRRKRLLIALWLALIVLWLAVGLLIVLPLWIP